MYRFATKDTGGLLYNRKLTDTLLPVASCIVVHGEAL